MGFRRWAGEMGGLTPNSHVSSLFHFKKWKRDGQQN